MANIHINPDAVTEVVAKHFPKKQVECIREYNTQLKASNGSGIAASNFVNISGGTVNSVYGIKRENHQGNNLKNLVRKHLSKNK